jgi:DNA-binding GntR family transcriptional regulator
MLPCPFEDRIHTSVRFHRHILRALRAGDLEDAQALLHQHVYSALGE